MKNLLGKGFILVFFIIFQQTQLNFAATYLRVQGTSFYYGSTKVFLSGPNIAWVSYGYDFGNGKYYGTSGSTLRSYVDEIANNGGNALRIWLHVEGQNTPAFDSNGYVTGTDASGTLITELGSFLDYAASKNVFVIIVLWNGAVMSVNNYKNLIWDTSKLQTYIDKALKPMVKALASKPALASWEIMNEPEGSVRKEANSNSCYDTTMIGNNWGAGWSGTNIPMFNFLRFINLQASAIRQSDSKALITVGSWSEHGQNDAFSDSYNYYKDNCLIGAGGKSDGIIDYYQMHTYAWQGKWSANAPFTKSATDYKLTKPLIIGEFSADCDQNEGSAGLFTYAYNKGYAGALSWQYNGGGDCSDSKDVQNSGMRALKGKTNMGSIAVKIQ